jgi:hypothetical protein
MKPLVRAAGASWEIHESAARTSLSESLGRLALAVM